MMTTLNSGFINKTLIPLSDEEPNLLSPRSNDKRYKTQNLSPLTSKELKFGDLEGSPKHKASPKASFTKTLTNFHMTPLDCFPFNSSLKKV